MKNTKENTIKLLKKMIDNARAVQNIYEEKGDKEATEFYKGEKLALTNALNLLEDKEYFNNIWNIFNK